MVSALWSVLQDLRSIVTFWVGVWLSWLSPPYIGTVEAPSPHGQLGRVFRLPEPALAILMALPTVDRLRLRQVSSIYRDYVDDLVYHIDHAFARWGLDGQEVRLMMKRTGAVVGGSWALAYLDGRSFAPNDLDLFTPSSTSQQWSEYLLQDGWRRVAPLPASTSTISTLPVSLGEMQRYSKGEKVVQLRLIEQSAAAVILKSSYSTNLTNFLTWDMAYSVFPRLTFYHRKMLPLNIDSGSQPGLATYERRGWTLQPFLGPRGAFSITRRFEDPHTWQHPLYPPLQQQASVAEHPLAAWYSMSSFQVAVGCHPVAAPTLHIHLTVMGSLLPRVIFVNPQESVGNWFHKSVRFLCQYCDAVYIQQRDPQTIASGLDTDSSQTTCLATYCRPSAQAVLDTLGELLQDPNRYVSDYELPSWRHTVVLDRKRACGRPDGLKPLLQPSSHY